MWKLPFVGVKAMDLWCPMSTLVCDVCAMTVASRVSGGALVQASQRHLSQRAPQGLGYTATNRNTGHADVGPTCRN